MLFTYIPSLKFGCDSEKTNVNVENPIHIWTKFNSIGCSTIILNHLNEIKDLQEEKSILCARYLDGNTPFHIIIHLLTSCCDFDLEIPNNSGYTPFEESIQTDFYEIDGILGCHYVSILGKSVESLGKLILPYL